ncbi:MAG: type II secretion system protein GspG [Candidatus Thiodiazotropha sp.]
MENDRKPYEEKLGCFPFVVGTLSFVPVFGVLVGLVVIIWGLVKWKLGGWGLVLIGTLGICFTVYLYGALFYVGFAAIEEVSVDHKVRRAQTQLNKLVRKIEYYKIIHGEYPESLISLKTERQGVKYFSFIYDPFFSFKDMQLLPYNYGRVNNDKNYFLSSSGPDRIEGTEDDIFPKLSEHELSVIGYIEE